MAKETKPKEQTPIEAAGYIGAATTTVARTFMPLRMWLLLACTAAFIITLFNTDELLTIFRATAAFFAAVSLLVCSKIFYQNR